MLLRQMEYLQAVIENGNFYLAAEQCHVSQSAISQQIKKLEDELGVKLLERHNRTFSLTQMCIRDRHLSASIFTIFLTIKLPPRFIFFHHSSPVCNPTNGARELRFVMYSLDLQDRS